MPLYDIVLRRNGEVITRWPHYGLSQAADFVASARHWTRGELEVVHSEICVCESCVRTLANDAARRAWRRRHQGLS